MIGRVIALVLLGLTITVDRADAVSFQLAGHPPGVPDNPDGISSFSLTADGIVATLTANIGWFNTNADEFGINAPGSADAPGLLDGASGTWESVTISFNTAVTFTQLVLAHFFAGAGDSATVTIGGAAPFALSPQASAIDTYNFANLVLPGESVLLRVTGGNGLSFNNFSVLAASPAVVEPSTVLLLGVGLIATAALTRAVARK